MNKEIIKDILSKEQFEGTHYKDIYYLTEYMLLNDIDKANEELVMLCNNGNLVAKTYKLIQGYFSNEKEFEEIREELLAISNAGYDYAGMIVKVYDSIKTGNRITTDEKSKVALTYTENAILSYIENGEKALKYGHNLYAYKFLGIELSEYQEQVMRVDLIRLVVNEGYYAEAREMCYALASDGNVIAQSYMLLMDYFNINKYGREKLPENCVKIINLPEHWEITCEQLSKNGYGYIDIIRDACEYKEWRDYTYVAPNDAYFFDMLYPTLRLILTGEVYWNSQGFVGFFGAEEFPHTFINKDEMTIERTMSYFGLQQY